MRFLLLNQTFHPDEMATGQYLTDVALALIERGHQVTVCASRRSYDAPHRTFPAQEIWRGIKIIRVASSWFGKGAKWKRCVDFSSFLLMCAARLSSWPRQDVVVALTSPPLIGLLGACLAKWHGAYFVNWVMDLNPDEAIAVGWLKPCSAVARLLELISRFCLTRAHKIIALDHFMQSRILDKNVSASRIVVLPLWSRGIHFDAERRQRFREFHGLQKKFVVMYSGNHSPCHPLDSLLKAAACLAEHGDILFCFVGGGSEFRKLRHLQQQSNFPYILCLPYQSAEQLAGSLSAADLHVIIMGEALVGIVHPCKVYNLINLGTPILYIGPEPSPVIQLLLGGPSGGALDSVCPDVVPRLFPAQHGEVGRIVKHITQARKVWVTASSRGTPVSSDNSRAKLTISKMVEHLEMGLSLD